jgi:hypothetical protein
MSAVTGQYRAYQQRNWRTWAYIVAGALGGVLVIAATLHEPLREEPQARNVSWDCHSAACLSPRQVVSASEARQMKRRLGSHALIVDVRSPASPAGPFGPGVDARIPFVERMADTGIEFRLDFGHRIDEAMRASRMAFDDPVIVTSPSVEQSVMAALLLQERGYSNLLVVAD